MQAATSSETDQLHATPQAEAGGHEDELAAYLRRIEVPDLDADGPSRPTAPRVMSEGQEIGEAPPAPPIDQETFYGVVFSAAFNVPGLVMPRFAPLAIQPGEEPTARAASDACYELLRIYYPQALQPGSETLGHLLTAGPFLVAKALVVRTIMLEMRAERARPANRDQGPAQEKADTQERAPDPSRAFDFMDEERQAA
ncbi:hypothetical protein SAMN06297129_2440 [Pseudooceanicola antarcticus]|uniref:Uncharacterized protein n=2 Tax=Pseudooceanicola antarcticus TaxID=1247613 RepID=A0A285IY58_9RHOB|nr:hypothetical protein CVM39_18875 [Pseudooceanicola antarcticus]SNY52914.1 hypothetical protein SAMN06297129_2440 [Pseudooceanicola antarcticus]